MVNLLYVCVQYVLHIPSWGSQLCFFSQKYPTPSPPHRSTALGSIMDIQCFISTVKQRRSSNFGVSLNAVFAAAEPQSFLVYLCSSLEDFFPRFALTHSHGLLASLQRFSNLCIHITMSKVLLEDFLYILFCFFTIFINIHIQWKAGDRFWLHIISSHELQNSQKMLQTEFIFMSKVDSLFHCQAVM